MPGYGRGFGGGYGRGYGQGFGRGFRGGRGWGRYEISPRGASPSNIQSGYYPPYDERETVPTEIDALKSQEKYLSNALKDLKKRIQELESRGESSTNI
ncbi:MAG: hypothetical protein GY855_04650 [candidate division Zixibacteria bacterium]|nr:hypothetical protein [candidate division Zixibacteria bacterium]